MPNTKSSDIRYKVIDRCLRRGNHNLALIMEKVNNELEAQGYPVVTATNTIRNDISYIEATYPQIIINVRRSGRNIYYEYDDPNSSIYNLQLSEDELSQLSQCMAILSNFEGLPQSDWIQSFIQKAKLSLGIDIDVKNVVGFDSNRQLKGRRFFATLLEAISKKIVLSIEYQRFHKEPTKHIIHPYYLKEYNNRWFLFCLKEGRDDISIFALDRIISIDKVQNKVYRENTQCDFNGTYFEDIVGVSNHGKIFEVRLLAQAHEAPYILTKPIHKSQSYELNPDGSVYITLKVKINYELKQLLLSYGEHITILEPEFLREEIASRLAMGLQNYMEPEEKANLSDEINTSM